MFRQFLCYTAIFCLFYCSLQGQQKFVVTTAVDIVDNTDQKLSLREAILRANILKIAATISFDRSIKTIQVAQGEMQIATQISLQGPLTLDAQGQSRIFAAIGGANVDFADITFRNGNIARDGGGAVFADGTTQISFINCTFEDNVADGAGGAVATTGNVSQINNCVFRNNQAADDGGALALRGNVAVIAECQFNDNVSGNTGGAIAQVLGNINLITGCIFSRNNANTGGAIGVAAGITATIADCQFLGNSAIGNGGAIQITGDIGSILNSFFVGNVSGANGGAIFQNGNLGQMSFGVFSQNQATIDGGAYFNQGGAAQFALVVFDNNACGGNGGGALLKGQSSTLRAVVFRDNQALDGGGVFADLAQFIDSTFDGNTAANNGGGAFVALDVLFNRCTFVDNEAENDGGGSFFDASASGTITNSTYSANKAGNDGGGNFDATVESSGIVFSFCTITKNSAKRNGGGMATADAGVDAATAIDNTIVDNNSASSGRDLFGFFIDNGFNLIEKAEGHNIVDAINGNIVDQGSANLKGLVNNGGITRTHEPRNNSRAINAGSVQTPVVEDQRALLRPDSSEINDIGAVEVGAIETFLRDDRREAMTKLLRIVEKLSQK